MGKVAFFALACLLFVQEYSCEIYSSHYGSSSQYLHSNDTMKLVLSHTKKNALHGKPNDVVSLDFILINQGAAGHFTLSTTSDDGFMGPISLKDTYLGPGVQQTITVSNMRVPARKDGEKVRFTLMATRDSGFSKRETPPTGPGGSGSYPGGSGVGGSGSYPGGSGVGGSGSYPGGSGVGGSGSYPGGSGVGGSGSYPGGSGVGGSGSYPGGSGVGGSGSYPGGSGGSGSYPGGSGVGGSGSYPGGSGSGGSGSYPGGSGVGGSGSYPGGSGVGGSGSYPGGSGLGGSGSYPGGSGVGGSGSYPGGSGVGGSGSYPGGSGIVGSGSYPGGSGIGGSGSFPGGSAYNAGGPGIGGSYPGGSGYYDPAQDPSNRRDVSLTVEFTVTNAAFEDDTEPSIDLEYFADSEDQTCQVEPGEPGCDSQIWEVKFFAKDRESGLHIINVEPIGREPINQKIYFRYLNFDVGTTQKQEIGAVASCCTQGMKLRVTDVAGVEATLDAQSTGVGSGGLSPAALYGIIGGVVGFVLIVVIVIIVVVCRKKYTSVSQNP